MNKLFILNGIPVGVFIPVLILCLACGCFVGFLILRYTFKKSFYERIDIGMKGIKLWKI